MKILFVSYLKSILGIDMMMKIQSLGLISIAANLDRELCDVKVLDLLMDEIDNKRIYFHNYLMEYKPDIVGISCITLQYEEAIELSKMIKNFDNNIKVVWGGYHPTLDYERILESKDMEFIDFLIRGEAEIAFNELIKALNKDKDFTNISNLSYKDNGKIIHNPMAELLNVDEIKMPDRSVRVITEGFHFMGIPADIVEFSRGCYSNCNFCCSPVMYGRTLRKFKIERIIEDIKDAQKYGAKSIFVADHNVTADAKFYKEICEAIIENGLNNIKYGVQASVQAINNTSNLAELMVKSGVEWVLLGIENISEENLKFMNKSKQYNSSDVYNVVSSLQKYGATVVGTFVFGNPDDSEESIMANYEYAKKLKVDIASFLSLTPYPNTPARKTLIEQGFVTNLHNYSKYNLWDANVRTKHLTSDELLKLIEKCDSKFQLDSGAIWRLIGKYPAYMLKLIFTHLFKKPLNVFRRFKK